MDLTEMARRFEQEALLHAHGFAPLLEDGRELFVRTGAEHPELFRRGRALVVALEELAAGDPGNRSHANSLTGCNDVSSSSEREEKTYGHY